jgi:hypothetical protein
MSYFIHDILYYCQAMGELWHWVKLWVPMARDTNYSWKDQGGEIIYLYDNCKNCKL